MKILESYTGWTYPCRETLVVDYYNQIDISNLPYANRQDLINYRGCHCGKYCKPIKIKVQVVKI